MTGEEMLVIIGGLFFGYLIVTFIMEKKGNNSSQDMNDNENSTGSNKTKSGYKTADGDSSKQPFKQEQNIATSWYRILEVSETATLGEITLQYKRRISEYHPDKVASLGKDLQQLAELKSKEITSAYNYAKLVK